MCKDNTPRGKMGSGYSLFGCPEMCDGCGTREDFVCKWRVNYNHSDFMDAKDAVDIISVAKNTTLYDAQRRCKEVEHLTGPIRVTHGREIKMYQRLYDKCYDVERLEELPDEWYFEVHHKPEGYEQISLP